MKAPETSILDCRKKQTDGYYARISHASLSPEATLLASDPAYPKKLASFFLSSLIRASRSQSKQGSKQVPTDYCMPRVGLCTHLFFITSLQGRYQYFHLTVEKTEAQKGVVNRLRSPRVRD